MKREDWPRLAAAAVGFAWFIQIGGGRSLNPSHVEWLMSGDWLQHWMGWLFFRNDAWTFPLGRISSLAFPVGTTVGFTDSNPLVSILLKPFSNLLPVYVQFIGPWLALCFTLQGYMGAALSSVVTRNPWQQFLGGALIAMSPALASRLGHDTLCAHWILVGLLYLGLRDYSESAAARQAAWWAAGAAVLSSSIHPYLAAMCWTLAHAFFARLWLSSELTLLGTLRASAATTAGMMSVFGAIGYFGGAELGTGGFGLFSADLLTLVSPMGYSRVMPDLVGIHVYQWEGYAYLGLGGLLLVAVAVATSFRRRPSTRRHLWPVVTVCVVMACYALSTVVKFNGREVLRLDWLTPTNTPFRASGRFIWSFHYLLLLFGIWGAARALRSRRTWLGTALLAAAVAVQAGDVRGDSYWFSRKDFRQVRLFNFRLAIGHYRHLELYPAQVLNVTPEPYEEALAYQYMFLAYKLRMTYNSGVYARLDAKRVRQAAGWTASALNSKRLDSQTIYVVAAEHLERFREANAVCGQLDGDWVCVGQDSHGPFREYLGQHATTAPQPPRTPAWAEGVPGEAERREPSK